MFQFTWNQIPKIAKIGFICITTTDSPVQSNYNGFTCTIKTEKQLQRIHLDKIPDFLEQMAGVDEDTNIEAGDGMGEGAGEGVFSEGKAKLLHHGNVRGGGVDG